MKPPPKKERGLAGAALKANRNKQEYHHAQGFQALLHRRLNRTASTAEIVPLVLAQLLHTSPTRRKI
jgi:hypothetical protein